MVCGSNIIFQNQRYAVEGQPYASIYGRYWRTAATRSLPSAIENQLAIGTSYAFEVLPYWWQYKQIRALNANFKIFKKSLNDAASLFTPVLVAKNKISFYQHAGKGKWRHHKPIAKSSFLESQTLESSESRALQSLFNWFSINHLIRNDFNYGCYIRIWENIHKRTM